MKLFSFLVCLCVSLTLAEVPDDLSQEAEVQGIIDDFINTTINGVIADLEDPLIVNTTYQRFNNIILTGWLNVSDLDLVGLKSIVASYIDVSYQITPPSSINLTIVIEGLNLFLNYETSLIVGQLVPFSGKGNISANLDTLTIKLFTLADVILIPTSIGGFKNTTIDITVGENTFLHIEGIYNSANISKSVNDFIDLYLPRIIDFIDTNEERISRVISPILQAILDSIFNNDPPQ